MRSKNKEPKPHSLVSVASLIGILLVSMLLSTTFVGCANKRPILYPLEHDFYKISGGGWFMSDFYLCNVMGVDVQGVNCDEVKTNE